MKNQSNIQFILNHAGKEKGKIYLSAFFSVLSSLCALMPYVLMYHVIRLLMEGSGDQGKITVLVFWTCAAMVGQVLLTFTCLALSHIAAFSILFELRIKAIQHLGKLNLGFFRENSSGALKKAVDEDVEKLELFIAHQIPDLTESIVTPVVTLLYLLHLDWRLALVLCIPLILVFISQYATFKNYGERMKEYTDFLKVMHSTIVQYIQGMAVFKAFNMTAGSFKKYNDTVQRYLKMWIQMTHENMPIYALDMVLIDSGLVFTIPIGGVLYLSGTMDGAAYVMFLLLSSVFLNAFLKILELGSNLAMLLSGAENLRHILETKPTASGNLTSPQKIRGDIEFKDVSFCYIDQEVIHNLSFKAQAGTSTALVGPSGSGKTTLAMLIGRFWDIESGEILIDGKNVKEYDVEALMNLTSFVFQDTFMLHDSVLENIRMGMDRSFEQVVQAAKKAEIHDFIMTMEKGYETRLGEDSGIKLSGGEKQRISIARAILKDAPLILLDEVTSYSDIENEGRIQEALKNLMKGKTAIIIAHRLYTIKNVDQIIALEEGRIIEQGNHRQLMEKGGLYAHLWNLGEEGSHA